MQTIQLTKEKFKEAIFDYEKSQDWDYKGEMPAIIDFYADWCGPCKAIAPILEELAQEFNGKIKIYKVDTEAEQELSAMFGIRSIPSILFIPMDKQPMMQKGALPKHVLQEVINKELLTETVK
jgi:thioredoxin